MNAILTPEAPTVALPWWMPSAETEAERERILRGRYFLIRTAGNGASWRCRRCNGVHAHLTLMCVAQPWSGLSRGLFAYWKTVGAYQGREHLTPAERSRYDDLERMFGAAKGLPDFASAHPQTIRRLGVNERDADLGAIPLAASSMSSAALGVAEPITRAEAAKLAAKINGRGIRPKFTLEGVTL